MTMNGNHKNLDQTWATESRWHGITRPYTQKDVEQLRGSVPIEHTLARVGAERLWDLLHKEPYVAALGALTGNQAVQQVGAGLQAIYLSGWQVAADANNAGQMYPDQSLYPANAGPELRISGKGCEIHAPAKARSCELLRPGGRRPQGCCASSRVPSARGRRAIRAHAGAAYRRGEPGGGR